MGNFEQSREKPRQTVRKLWICPKDESVCGSELVYPVDWSEEGPRHWRIVLRCPNCENVEEGVFSQPEVERLDEALDRGSTQLLGDLRRMTHANMSEEIEFWAKALDADLITPDDF